MTSQTSINNEIFNNDFSVNRSLAGTDVVSLIAHSDNTAVASNAILDLTVGGTTSTGDPFAHFLITGSTEYSFGIDNDDSDMLKLTSGATPSAGIEYAVFNGLNYIYFQTTNFSNIYSNAGNTNSIQVYNSDNTNVDSHAVLQARAGGDSGGDAFFRCSNTMGVGNSYTFGLDNSDSDKLKLTNGENPSAGTEYMSMTTTGAISILAGNVDITRDTSGAGNVSLTIDNTDNTAAASNALLDITVGGATSIGDPFIHWQITGSTENSFGIDNDDSDILKITTGATPSAGTVHWAKTTAGERTMPLQPAFLAYNNANLANQTGNGAQITVRCNTEFFDQNADFNTGTYTFTAPVTGKYKFDGVVALYNMTAATDKVLLQLITTGNTYNLWNTSGLPSVDGIMTAQGSILVDMTATDTAYLRILVDGEVGNTVGFQGAATGLTIFSGFLCV